MTSSFLCVRGSAGRFLTIVGALALAVVPWASGCSKTSDESSDEGNKTENPADKNSAATKKKPVGKTPDSTSGKLPSDDKLDWYRIVVESEEAPEVPAFVGFDGKGVAVVANGDERLPATGTVTDDKFDFLFPVMGTKLVLKKKGKRYEGKWYGKFYFHKNFKAWAEKVDKPSPLTRFSDAKDPPSADISGSWLADIEVFGKSGMVFRQKPDGEIQGTILPPDVGDTRYMAGKVSGKRVQASTFDGMHSYLLDAKLRDDDVLEGHWSFSGVGHWKFTAKRGERPGLDHILNVKTIDDVRTVTIEALDEPPYLGNPVIVDYFGTWCPACLDLTPQLARLYEKYKDQGLQIHAVALELDTDRVKVNKRIENYKARYNIPWEIDIRQVENVNDELPIEFDDVQGFPLTLFLNRDHTIEGMSTAFVSEAAPEEHKAMVELFEKWTKAIVNSKPPKPGKKSEK